MPRAMMKAVTMPDRPPMALPIVTIRTVRRASRNVVLSLCIVFTSTIEDVPKVLFRLRANKKTFTLGIATRIKVLLAGCLPRFRVLRPY